MKLKEAMEDLGVREIKPHIYTTLVTLSLLRGLYLDDQEIIICSLLVLPMCVIFFIEHLNKKE
jgi:hypothetical protein